MTVRMTAGKDIYDNPIEWASKLFGTASDGYWWVIIPTAAGGFTVAKRIRKYPAITLDKILTLHSLKDAKTYINGLQEELING